MMFDPAQIFILVKILDELNSNTDHALCECIGKLLSTHQKLIHESYLSLIDLHKKQPNHKVILFLMAFHLQFGLGCASDMKKAFNLYQKSAAQNYIPAQFKMALFYERGLFLKENKKKRLNYMNT